MSFNENFKTILRTNYIDDEEYDLDDIIIHNTSIEIKNEKMEYLLFDFEKKVGPMKYQRVFKAIKLVKIKRVPKKELGVGALLEMEAGVITGLYQSQINYIQIFANIVHPTKEGLIFAYGAQGVSDTSIDEAKHNADIQMAAVRRTVTGTFRTMEFLKLTASDARWIFEKLGLMKDMRVIRGIPAPKINNLQPQAELFAGVGNVTFEEQNEEFLLGMDDYEYLFVLTATGVAPEVLSRWREANLKEQTYWASIKNGQKSMSFGISMPMVYGSNASTSSGWGTNRGQSFGTNFSHSTGTNESFSTGTSHSFSHGTSSSISTGVTQGTSANQSYSASNGSNWSTGASTSLGHSVGSGTSASIGHSTGTSTSDSTGTSTSTGESYSTGTSTSHSLGTSDSTSVSTGTSASHGTSTSVGSSVGYNAGKSYSHSGSSSAGTTTGSDIKGSVSGGVISFSGGGSTGTSKSWGQGESFGSTAGYSSGSSASRSSSNSYGVSTSRGYSTGTSESYGTGTSTSRGTSLSNGTSTSHGVGTSTGLSTSNGTSTSDSVSTGSGTSNGYGQSTGSGASAGVGSSTSFSKSVSQGVSDSESYGTSTGHSVGSSDSYSSGTSTGSSTGSSTSGGYSTGSSGSMGLGPSISFAKTFAWEDREVAYILDQIVYATNRIIMGTNNVGMWFVDVYLACENEEAAEVASSLAMSAWHEKNALVAPLQVYAPSDREREYLLKHMSVFSPSAKKDARPGQIESYKYTSLLLSNEIAAYCHPPRVNVGGIQTSVDDPPVLTIPANRQKGEIFLGYVADTEKYSLERGYKSQFRYTLSSSEIHHAYISGASRSGKTVAAMRLVAETYNNVRRGENKKRLRFLIMDPKNDWRALSKVIPSDHFRFYSLSNPQFRPVRLNLMKIPRGVYTERYADKLREIFIRSYGLGDRGFQILGKAIQEVYKEAGCFDPDVKFNVKDPITGLYPATERSKEVTLADVTNHLRDEAESKGTTRDKQEAIQRIVDRLDSFSEPLSSIYTIFCNKGEDGFGIDDLLGADDVIVLESYGMDAKTSAFVFGLLTSSVYQYAVSNGGFVNPKDQYETVLVIEEANQVLIGEDEDNLGGQNPFETILDQSAGYGLFIWTLTQKISDMPRSVLANSALKLIGRQDDDLDIDKSVVQIGKEGLITDRVWKEWFPDQPTGWFIIKSSRNRDFTMNAPCHVLIEYMDVQPPSDEELDQLLKFGEMKHAMKAVETGGSK